MTVDASATTRYGETVGYADEGESILQGRAAVQVQRKATSTGQERKMRCGESPDRRMLLNYKERFRLPVPNS
jgi:hypothetical protein